MNTINTQFENCDQFADFIIDSVLDHGDKVTAEFNKLTNLDIPKGTPLTEWLLVNPQMGDNFKKFGTVKSFLYDIYEFAKSPLFKYFDKARQAYYWNSMDPYRAAKRNIIEHIQELNSDLAEIPAEDQSWYTEKYIKMYLDWLSAKGRTASSMVTGPAKFPTERNRKALNSEHNKYQDFQVWREKTKVAILRKIDRNKSEDQKRDEKWLEIKKHIIHQSAVIVGIDNGTEPYHRALFVNSLVGKIETAAKHGEHEIVEKSLSLIEELNNNQKKPIITSRHKVWKLREKAFDIAQAKENPKEQEAYDIEGGQIIINHADDRIQIKHVEKPAKEVIELLKKNSFKWSGLNKCWQRKITLNTKYSIKIMFGIAIK